MQTRTEREKDGKYRISYNKVPRSNDKYDSVQVQALTSTDSPFS